MSDRIATLSKTLVALALGVSACAAHAVELRGFRGISWGDGSVALGAAVLVSQEGKVTCYQRERENLLFGDSELSGVRYCFEQDRLFLVSVESAQRPEVLAGEFGRTYGSPQRLADGRLSWQAKPGASGAEVLAVAQGRPGSSLMLYSTQFDRKAIQGTMQRLAAAPGADSRVAYLAK